MGLYLPLIIQCGVMNCVVVLLFFLIKISLYYVKVILKCKTMEMLFCGSPTLVINVLVNILGWEDGTRSMN